jgi:hypothetical protein
MCHNFVKFGRNHEHSRSRNNRYRYSSGIATCEATTRIHRRSIRTPQRIARNNSRTLGRRRFQNVEAIGNKAHFILLNIGVAAKEVPLNIIHPLIGAASLQEDPELQEIWANLLANAADPREVREVSPIFSDILKEMRMPECLETRTSRRFRIQTRKSSGDYTGRHARLRIHSRNGITASHLQ